MKKIDRTGEIGLNIDGLEMKIIKYNNNKDMRVLFTASGQIRKATYKRFKEGKVYPTHRNKVNNDNLAEFKSAIDDSDNYDAMRHIGWGLAITLALGLGCVGLGIVVGIIYAVIQLFQILC